MAGLSLTLETAKSTLLNTQTQIQVTSHNIANAENKSYARQKAVVVTNTPNLSQGSWIGTGASVETVIQMRTEFIEQRLMASVSKESYHETLSTQLAIAQTTFSDNGSTGISQALGAFWDSWDALIQNPQGTAEQSGVYSAADRLAQTISTAYSDMDHLANTELPEQIQGTVDKANDLIQRVADFNLRIMENESPGHFANDLRDGRYQALTELSEILPVQFREEANGSVTLTFSDGTSPVTLVSGSRVSQDPLQYNENLGQVIFTAYDASSTSTWTAAGSNRSGGALEGLLVAQDDVNAYMQSLDDFASTLIREVNAVYNPTGDPNAADVFTPGGNASNIQRDSDFFTGQSPETLSGKALTMSSLQEEAVGFPGGTTTRFSEYLGDVQRQMGLDHQTAKAQASFYESLRAELDFQQQSVSGVSLDEEMVDLLKYQQVYQAAAKIIQQTVEMLNRILEIR
jgi:flagellar hook-associated protein FlgK